MEQTRENLKRLKRGRLESEGPRRGITNNSHVAASLWRVADAGRRVGGDLLVVSNDDNGTKAI